MKEKRFVKGTIIVFLTIGIVFLLFANFNEKLNDLLKKTDMQCNETADECYKDLKTNVFFSKEARSIIIYTGILTLGTLNIGAFCLYHFCINKELLNYNSEKIEEKDVKNNAKRRRKNKSEKKQKGK